MPSPQPVMQMPPTMMSGPPGFAPAMPRPSAPVAMPVAAPFPTATAVVAVPAAQPAAPPARPPAAPQRPIDELESLTSQPTPRRRIWKKKKTKDYTTEIIIGSVVAVAGILLFIVYVAIAGNSKSGFGASGNAVEKPPEKIGAKFAEERKQKEKEIEKEKKEKAKKAAATQTSVSGDAASPLRPFSADVRRPKTHSQAADDGESPLPTPHEFGPPSRTMDSPNPGGPVQPGPQPDGQDNPRDLSGDNDPVMGPPPKPEKSDP